MRSIKSSRNLVWRSGLKYLRVPEYLAHSPQIVPERPTSPPPQRRRHMRQDRLDRMHAVGDAELVRDRQ